LVKAARSGTGILPVRERLLPLGLFLTLRFFAVFASLREKKAVSRKVAKDAKEEAKKKWPGWYCGPLFCSND